MNGGEIDVGSIVALVSALGGGGTVTGLIARAILSKAMEDLRKEYTSTLEAMKREWATAIDKLRDEIKRDFKELDDRERESRRDRQREHDEVVGRVAKLEGSYQALHTRMENYDGSRTSRSRGRG